MGELWVHWASVHGIVKCCDKLCLGTSDPHLQVFTLAVLGTGQSLRFQFRWDNAYFGS
jgi:hypothetical protein